MRGALVLWLASCAIAQGQTAEGYKEFQREVAQIIKTGQEVAVSDQERSDLRVLAFLSRDLNKHIATGDWGAAAATQRKMQVALQRSSGLANIAPQRKAHWEKAERQRQHQEVLNQNARQHKELMNQLRQQQQQQLQQQQIINSTRNRTKWQRP